MTDEHLAWKLPTVAFFLSTGWNWYYNQYALSWFTELRTLKSRKTMQPPLQDLMVKSGCVFIVQYLSGDPEAHAPDK
ncbi:hypothetical protein [Microcoleus vaginatus]|uniref:hypothetical protein n=1 Tax=Microcoleus vaginatus TaxID=119532 RepID=UPI001689C6E9|nr:hypothetical protein [Microcoleus sp. FACHB-84]MBD2010513.1 hypothetical protein [Microcoleus sp. FACHB-45]